MIITVLRSCLFHNLFLDLQIGSFTRSSILSALTWIVGAKQVKPSDSTEEQTRGWNRIKLSLSLSEPYMKITVVQDGLVFGKGIKNWRLGEWLDMGIHREAYGRVGVS